MLEQEFGTASTETINESDTDLVELKQVIETQNTTDNEIVNLLKANPKTLRAITNRVGNNTIQTRTQVTAIFECPSGMIEIRHITYNADPQKTTATITHTEKNKIVTDEDKAFLKKHANQFSYKGNEYTRQIGPQDYSITSSLPINYIPLL